MRLVTAGRAARRAAYRAERADARRAFADRDAREVTGQVLRAALAGTASLAGRIPTGNDGRARTPLSNRMSVPRHMEPVLQLA